MFCKQGLHLARRRILSKHLTLVLKTILEIFKLGRAHHRFFRCDHIHHPGPELLVVELQLGKNASPILQPSPPASVKLAPTCKAFISHAESILQPCYCNRPHCGKKILSSSPISTTKGIRCRVTESRVCATVILQSSHPWLSDGCCRSNAGAPSASKRLMNFCACPGGMASATVMRGQSLRSPFKETWQPSDICF